MRTGTVKWFNDRRGFGFISHEGADLFVLASAVNTDTSGTLSEGDSVEFEIACGYEGHQAVNVRRK